MKRGGRPSLRMDQAVKRRWRMLKDKGILFAEGGPNKRRRG